MGNFWGKYFNFFLISLLIGSFLKAEDSGPSPLITARRPKVTFKHTGSEGAYKDIEVKASIYQKVGATEELFQEISVSLDVVIKNSILLNDETEEFSLFYGIKGPQIEFVNVVNSYDIKYEKGVFYLTGKSREKARSIASDFLVYFKKEGSRLALQFKDIRNDYLKSTGEKPQWTLEYSLKKDSGSLFKRNPLIETKKIVIENDAVVSLADGINLDSGTYILADIYVTRIGSKFYAENRVSVESQPPKIQF